MTAEFRIPLNYREGQYNYKDISSDSDEQLAFSLDDWNIITYTVPCNGAEVRLYSVENKPLENYLYATYNETGMLKYLEIIQDDETRLVYIGYADHDDAKAEILDFAEQSADIFSEQILSYKGKIARIFIDYYKWFNYGIKVVTPEEQQEVIDRLPENKKSNARFVEYIKNSSGEYSTDKFLFFDKETIDTMLSCTPKGSYDEFAQMVIDVMTENIKKAVADKIDKTDDFRIIAEEYD